MLVAGCSSIDTDYESDLDRLEAAEKVFSHVGGRDDVMHPFRRHATIW